MAEKSTPRHTLIIAEAGVNHNGSLDTALALVDTAAAAGADIVKFQTFKAASIASASARKAEYQTANMADGESSQLEMLRRLELSEEDHRAIMQRCELRGIRFLSTPFDLESVDLLASLGINLWKIPSGEITNLPLLRKIGRRGEEIILSTGMCEMEEVEAAVMALEEAGTPREHITLLHCTTQYPAPVESVNLRAIDTLRSLGTAGVGYSDHTVGITIPVAAVALGASVIEKHFTLDRSMPGPDHKASLEPDELAEMVRSIRAVEQALGDGAKHVAPCEGKNMEVARKSIVAARPISKGELLSDDNLTVKRPGTGLSPMLWDSVIGTPATRDYLPDDPIQL